MNTVTDSPSDHTTTSAKHSTAATVWGFVLSIISAVLLFTMWARHGNIWPFVFIGFVPMFIASYRLLPRRLAPFAYAIATFGYTFALGLDGGGVLPITVILLWAAGIGAAFFVIGIFERRFAVRTSYRWFIVQFALIWTACEVLFQGNLIVGTNYWIEYRTAAAPWMGQAVSLTSTPAWGFVIIMFNAAIALLIIKAMDSRWPDLSDGAVPPRTVAWSAIIGIGAMIAWLGTSALINSGVSSNLGPSVRVASIQTGIQNTTSSGLLGEGADQSSPEDIARNEVLKQQLIEMTRDAANQGAKLAVWPEETLDYDVRVGDRADWVGDLARETGMTIVAGFMPDSPDLTSPNLATVWYPSGQMSDQVYAKEHQVVAEGEAFAAGSAPAVYPTDVGQLGVIICFDHDFPNSSPRQTVIAGADIVAVPAIDPYTLSQTRWQSLVFRALENRVPFVKTDIGFDSAIVNANGQVMTRVATTNPEGSTAVLVADVNLGPRDAPAIQYGTYPLAALVVFFLAWRYVRHVQLRRQEKSTGSEVSA